LERTENRWLTRLATVLLPAIVPAAVALAHAGTWQENVAVLIQLDGKANGAAHVFDSDDYQRMLLVLDDRPTALILHLAEGAVYGVPRDSVHISDDGSADIGIVGEDFLTGLEHKDGTVRFTWDDQPFAIQPLPPLLGPAPLKQILELKPSYALAAQLYKPDPTKLALIRSVTHQTEIHVYFGTWCLLCKRLLPGFIRTIELAANPRILITYIGVDEDITRPEAELERDHITKSPTILVLQEGREIGRIEEKTDTTIEADLAGILAPPR